MDPMGHKWDLAYCCSKVRSLRSPLVFTLNPYERAWTRLQETPRSLPSVQSPMSTAEFRNAVEKGQARDIVRQADGLSRQSTFKTRSESLANTIVAPKIM